MSLAHISECPLCCLSLLVIKQHQTMIRQDLNQALKEMAPYLAVVYGQIADGRFRFFTIPGGRILKYESLAKEMVEKFRTMLTRMKRDEGIVIVENPKDEHVGIYLFPLSRPIKRIRMPAKEKYLH